MYDAKGRTYPSTTGNQPDHNFMQFSLVQPSALLNSRRFFVILPAKTNKTQRRKKKDLIVGSRDRERGTMELESAI